MTMPFSFALDHQAELFSQIPIVFLGVNVKPGPDKLRPILTLPVLIEADLNKETLEIARVFNPRATRVVGITDETLTGQGNHPAV